MSLRSLFVAFASIALAPPQVAQSTWTVDIANGPGTDFTEIRDALPAIAPGDTLLVRNGLYQPFTVTRGVRIIADWVSSVDSGYSVRNVPAGETVAIRDLHAFTAAFSVPASISIHDNAGSVRIHGTWIHTFSEGVTEIVNSPDVSFVDSTLSGVTLGARVTNSTVRLDNCTIVNGYSLTGNDPALHCIESRIDIGGASVVLGAPQNRSVPTTGILLESGVITVGAAATVASGRGYGTKSAIESTGGTIIVDPTAVVSPHVGFPPISGSATVIERIVPTVRIDSAIAAGSFAGDVLAPPGSTVATFIGLPIPRLPTVFGDLWAAGPLTIIDAGVVPSNGERRFQLTTGATTPVGFSLTAQAIVLHNSEFTISTASTPVFKR